jgi:hypothetical protein
VADADAAPAAELADDPSAPQPEAEAEAAVAADDDEIPAAAPEPTLGLSDEVFAEEAPDSDDAPAEEPAAAEEPAEASAEDGAEVKAAVPDAE